MISSHTGKNFIPAEGAVARGMPVLRHGLNRGEGAQQQREQRFEVHTANKCLGICFFLRK